MKKEAGHSFLARLGKTRLRPGGVQATNWLIEQGCFDSSKRVLEVACNMGTTMVQLAKDYGCEIIGLDQDQRALDKANFNIQKNSVSHLVTTIKGSAFSLPFADESFDIVVNEAMLTMFSNENKLKALSEYYRVLKPGGILLTHDVCLPKADDQQVNELRRVINVPVQPLIEHDWINISKEAGFVSIETKVGPMSLMSPRGLIRDEGFKGALKIIRNGIKKENRHNFKAMFNLFNNKENPFNYIAMASRKGR